MGRFKSFLKSCSAAIASFLRGTRIVFRTVYEGGKAVLRPFIESSPPIMQAIEQAAEGILGMPMALIKGVLGIKPPAPRPEDAAKAAEAKAKVVTAKVNAATDAVSQHTDVRAVLRKIARGGIGPQDLALLQRLPQDTAEYLYRLLPEEARILRALPPPILAATIGGERVQEGVRTRTEIERDWVVEMKRAKRNAKEQGMDVSVPAYEETVLPRMAA